MKTSLAEKIRGVDWIKYSGPEYYDPQEVVEALIDLSEFDESRARHGLDNKVLFAIGNNHAGTYYPAIIDAADILIELETTSNIEAVRKCAYAVLNNLFYFHPEVGSYKGHSPDELGNFVKNKLARYAD